MTRTAATGQPCSRRGALLESVLCPRGGPHRDRSTPAATLPLAGPILVVVIHLVLAAPRLALPSDPQRPPGCCLDRRPRRSCCPRCACTSPETIYCRRPYCCLPRPDRDHLHHFVCLSLSSRLFWLRRRCRGRRSRCLVLAAKRPAPFDGTNLPAGRCLGVRPCSSRCPCCARPVPSYGCRHRTCCFRLPLSALFCPVRPFWLDLSDRLR